MCTEASPQIPSTALATRVVEVRYLTQIRMCQSPPLSSLPLGLIPHASSLQPSCLALEKLGFPELPWAKIGILTSRKPCNANGRRVFSVHRTLLKRPLGKPDASTQKNPLPASTLTRPTSSPPVVRMSVTDQAQAVSN